MRGELKRDLSFLSWLRCFFFLRRLDGSLFCKSFFFCGHLGSQLREHEGCKREVERAKRRHAWPSLDVFECLNEFG